MFTKLPERSFAVSTGQNFVRYVLGCSTTIYSVSISKLLYTIGTGQFDTSCEAPMAPSQDGAELSPIGGRTNTTATLSNGTGHLLDRHRAPTSAALEPFWKGGLPSSRQRGLDQLPASSYLLTYLGSTWRGVATDCNGFGSMRGLHRAARYLLRM